MLADKTQDPTHMQVPVSIALNPDPTRTYGAYDTVGTVPTFCFPQTTGTGTVLCFLLIFFSP